MNQSEKSRYTMKKQPSQARSRATVEAIFTEIRRRQALKHFQRLTDIEQPDETKAILEHLITTHVAFVRDHREIYAAMETEVPRFAFETTEQAVLER